jgi:hypothetical protein
MDRAANFPEAGPALEMKAREETQLEPGRPSGQVASRLQRLRKAPWGRLVTPDDLYPLALLAFFLLLPPPLGNLVLALFGVLAIVIALRIWHRYQRDDS